MKVSVVLPTLDRHESLKSTIQYLLKQTFNDWELIIVDDSIDSASAVVQEISDHRIRYFHRGIKSGVSAARNFGAQLSSGNYLAFIDDDDSVTSSWLSDFIDIISEAQHPDVVMCGMEVIDPVLKTSVKFRPSTHINQYALAGSWIMNKTFFQQIGGYDEKLKYGESSELFYRVFQANGLIRYTDAINFIYQGSSDGGSKNLMNRIDSTLIVLEKHRSYLSRNKRTYRGLHDVIGVCYLRLGQPSKARLFFWRALCIDPLNVKSFFRFLLSNFSFISNKLYKISG